MLLERWFACRLVRWPVRERPYWSRVSRPMARSERAWPWRRWRRRRRRSHRHCLYASLKCNGRERWVTPATETATTIAGQSIGCSLRAFFGTFIIKCPWRRFRPSSRSLASRYLCDGHAQLLRQHIFIHNALLSFLSLLASAWSPMTPPASMVAAPRASSVDARRAHRRQLEDEHGPR